jgi:small ligand-binding sensory domain FIST
VTGRRYAAGLSRHPDAAEATAEVLGAVRDQLSAPPDGGESAATGPAPVSAAMVFASGRHIEALADTLDAIHTLLGPEVLVGTTAVGVVGGGEEIEQGDGIALWAASGFTVEPIRLEALPGRPPIVIGLPDRIEPGSTLVVVADPYTFPVDSLVAELNADHPGVNLVGGMASAPGPPERNRVVLGTEVHLSGAVGFVVPPGVATPIVSQGCRPIGSPWVVTEADGQMLRTLGGQPALDRLSQLIENLSDTDRLTASQGLHVGVVANELQAEFDQGDFLIRGLLGADRASGAVAVGDLVQVGQIVQFQVRDAASASAEMDRLLAGVSGRSSLLFTCNGRGTHLFPEPNHDASRVADVVGSAVSGMFCAGELGPIAHRNAVHGFTATILVFT